MAMPQEKTAVTAWLKKYGADEFITEFYNQGYYNIETVDDEAIKEIVEKDKAKPGIAKALKNSLAERKKREAEQAMEPPKLPPNTVLDLSAPELKSPDGITFSVPKSLSVEDTKAAIVSPNNIKPEQWSIIARSANLLYAYDMDGDEPKWAKTPILDWKVPARDDFQRSEISHAKVTSTLTYTDETASYVSSGFDTQTATAGYTFCAGSFERNNKETIAKKSEKKTLIMVGTWKYPRAQIYLDKCTITSKRFEKAVRKALAATDKYSELKKVFKEYGHVISSSVLLGGQLCYMNSREEISSAEEHKAENEIKAAVETKLSAVSAATGVALGSASDTQKGSVDLKEFTSFTNRGGDSLLCTNPPAWAPTVMDPANWAVIEMEGMRPTIDLLGDELKRKVLDVWSRGEAILDPMEIHDLKENEGAVYPKTANLTAVMMQYSGFAAAMRHCSEGARGSVSLVSGSGRDPKEGDSGTAAGAAYAHKNTLEYNKNSKSGDTWIECNSICMPVRQGGSFKTMFKNTNGNPDARLTFIPSNLSFGEWRSLKVTENDVTETTSLEDGFLFVNISASMDGCRGGVKGLIKGLINGKEIAGSYVHNFQKGDEWIEQQNFCIPVPKGATFRVVVDPSAGTPEIRAYWMPLHDLRWKMLEASPVTVNTQITAPDHGILHGWIKATAVGDRGTLKVYTGGDALSSNPAQLPCVAASMHYHEGDDRHVKYSSVMLPIAKGTLYKAIQSKTAGNPEAQVFWTAIVPA